MAELFYECACGLPLRAYAYSRVGGHWHAHSISPAAAGGVSATVAGVEHLRGIWAADLVELLRYATSAARPRIANDCTA